MKPLHAGLRAAAIAIATAGAIDPAWTVSRPASRQVIAIHAAADDGVEAERALRAALPGWDVESRTSERRLPCAPDERCVVMADGSKDLELPDDLAQPPALIAVMPGAGVNVAVRSVSVSSAHQHAAGAARVELQREVAVAQSEVRVLDGAAVVGSAIHKWSDATSATVEVPWWPIDSGARALRIEVAPVENERTTIDNHIDVGAHVGVSKASVLVFDARPSWHSTFVRRALEDDSRFTVGYRARLAPALSAGTANARLDAAVLDLAAVVVVGAPDALTADDVVLLARFVSVRGGSLILLPERAPSGPWSRLLPGAWTEHLTSTPEAVGPLRATEVLRGDRLPVTAAVIARSGSAPSIVELPSGHGRIVVAGAMDAWRYRDLDTGSFDRFWRSLIADSAERGTGVQLVFDATLGARGSRSRFTIRDRRMTAAASSEASAIARCGDGPAAAVRLWPADARGGFTGELPLTGGGACRVEAALDGRQVAGSIAVAEQPRRGVEQTLAQLERRIVAAGGTATRAGAEDDMVRALAAGALSPDVATAIHPMRTAWWLLPFTALLSIEWWLRRRGGLR